MAVVAAGSVQLYRDGERRRVLHFCRAEMSVTCGEDDYHDDDDVNECQEDCKGL